MKELLTQKELMEKLKIKRNKLLDLRKKGLPHFKDPLRFDYDKVIEWLEKQN